MFNKNGGKMERQEPNISELYRLKKSDLEKCAQVASKAFINDETSKFLLSSKLTQEALYEFYFVLYNAVYEKMYMFADSEDINGFIIFSSMENSEISLLEFIKAGGLKIIFSLGIDLIFRSLEYEKNCINIRKYFVQKNNWHIFQFGVNPEKQGIGLGSKIIKPVLNWFNSKNITCFLETHKDVNVDIYSHFGFVLKSIDTLPRKKEKQYSMFRSSMNFS